MGGEIVTFYFVLTGVVALDGTDDQNVGGAEWGRAEVCFRNASRQMGGVVLSWW